MNLQDWRDQSRKQQDSGARRETGRGKKNGKKGKIVSILKGHEVVIRERLGAVVKGIGRPIIPAAPFDGCQKEKSWGRHVG